MLNERGMTLVEILVATVIIGMGLVGLMTVIPIASYGLQQGNQLTTATFLADQKLEEVRNALWRCTDTSAAHCNNASATPSNDCLGLGSAAAPTVPAGASCSNGGLLIAAGGATFADEANVTNYTGYSRQVRITACSPTACAGVTDTRLRIATVSVTYTPLTGVGVSSTTQTVSSSMLVAQQ